MIVKESEFPSGTSLKASVSVSVPVDAVESYRWRFKTDSVPREVFASEGKFLTSEKKPTLVS